MVEFPKGIYDDKWILSKRGSKNSVDPLIPYAIHQEPELSFTGRIEEAGTIFLTNRECPFHCLMCDLWKNTTDQRVPLGAIPKQIKWALGQFKNINHIKLYNSGNFFDNQAIPKEDYVEICSLLKNYLSVIIENHPLLVNEQALEFRDMLGTDLEIAIGLETVHPKILPLLNKKMDLIDFEKSVRYLNKNNIRTRAFILLRPPFMSEKEGIYWAERSIEFAFDCGINCCVIIPTRRGNGAIDWLEMEGFYHPPEISSIEKVLEYGISLKRGRVFADLWDLEYFSRCSSCFDSRRERLRQMNFNQTSMEEIVCECEQS
jgi:radical SAM enzyme (TIGR01210 family)